MLSWAAERQSLASIEGFLPALSVREPQLKLAENLEIDLLSSSMVRTNETDLVPRLKTTFQNALCAEVVSPCRLTSSITAVNETGSITGRGLSESFPLTPSFPPILAVPPALPPLSAPVQPPELYKNLVTITLRRVRTAESVIKAGEAKIVLQDLLHTALPFHDGDVSALELRITELSADMIFDGFVASNHTIAANVAASVFILLWNVTSLQLSLQDLGIVASVTVEYVHPTVGLYVVQELPLTDPGVSQILASQMAPNVATTISTISSLVTASVVAVLVSAVAAAVGGTVVGVVGGAAGTASASGATGSAAGGGGSAGGGAVFPLIMGAQRLTMTADLAVEKSELQTGVAGAHCSCLHMTSLMHDKILDRLMPPQIL